MYNRFKELGIPVVITRDTDKTLSRQERLNIMRSLGTDPNVIILSNHINAGGGEGAEVVYPLRTSSTLPRMILESIGEEGQKTRKYYQRRLPEDPSKDYYYIMRETPNTTSLLIEYGFIDNPNDQRKLNNNIESYAEAVVRAVANYIGVPYTTNNSEEPTDTGIYTVKKGDTLYKIAKENNTTVEEILNLNNLPTTILSIGQTLLIPGKEIKPSTPSTYTVVPGDTLYGISRKFNTTVDELKFLNNLTSNTLSIGQILTIPGNTLNTIYKVVAGDNLYKIANRFNTTVSNLKEINNLVSDILQIGQELIIP